MSAGGGKSDDRLLFQVLSSLGGIAAVTLGILYLAGILLTYFELRSEGLSVADTLPLFPLEQVLRTGLTLVAPALLLLLILGAVMGVSVPLERRLRRLTGQFKRERVPELKKSERDDWIRKSDDALRRTNYDVISREIKKAEAEANSKGRTDRAKELRRMRWSFGGFSSLAYGIGVLWPASSLLFPPAVAIANFVLFVVALVLMLRFRPNARLGLILAVFYVILLGCIIASSFIYPRRFPAAEVVTDSGEALKGRLVLIADSTWYLSTGEGRLRAIPSNQVRCSLMQHTPGQRRVGATLLHLGTGEPPPLPPLHCGRKPQ